MKVRYEVDVSFRVYVNAASSSIKQVQVIEIVNNPVFT